MRQKAPYLSELATREVVALFKRIQAQVPGFIAASLVDLRSGTTLVTHSARADFDLATASVFNSEMVKHETKRRQELGSQSTLEEVQMTLSDQIHILKMVDAGTAFIYLAADRGSTNLAIASYVLNHHE